MARYTGPRCRLCRRSGVKLFLKGERCDTPKCSLDKRPNPPGMISLLPARPGARVRQTSSYLLQLREKQKLRYTYQILERQFKRYFQLAQKLQRKGVNTTGENLLSILERRLDNVVFRVGWANSRAEARQMVRHKHILVNSRIINIPSYLVKVNDLIAPTEKGERMIEKKKLMERVCPSWLRVEGKKAQVIRLPERSDLDYSIDTNLIVPLYSR